MPDNNEDVQKVLHNTMEEMRERMRGKLAELLEELEEIDKQESNTPGDPDISP